MPLSIQTMLHFEKAENALKANNQREAIRELEQFEAAFARESAFATPVERIATLGYVAKLYAEAGQPQLAIPKFQDVCDYAEEHEPGTSETAGDYATLAQLLEGDGQLAQALAAWETSARHLRQAGAWDRHKAGYEKHMAALRQRMAS